MRTVPLLFVALWLISGCTSRIPEPVAHPYSQQYKLQAAHHWQVLAADLADRVNNALILSDNSERPVYVKTTCGDEARPCSPEETSSFDEAFRDLLVTNLVAYGVPTSNRPEEPSAIHVLYKVQIVRHRSSRPRSFQPGLLTAISAAIVVLRDAPSELLTLAAGAGADLANTSFVHSGHHEVIVTTSMIDSDRYLFRASDIYYINDADFWQYNTTAPATATIRLQSGAVKSEVEKETFPEMDIYPPNMTPPAPDPSSSPRSSRKLGT